MPRTRLRRSVGMPQRVGITLVRRWIRSIPGRQHRRMRNCWLPIRAMFFCFRCLSMGCSNAKEINRFRLRATKLSTFKIQSGERLIFILRTTRTRFPLSSRTAIPHHSSLTSFFASLSTSKSTHNPSLRGDFFASFEGLFSTCPSRFFPSHF